MQREDAAKQHREVKCRSLRHPSPLRQPRIVTKMQPRKHEDTKKNICLRTPPSALNCARGGFRVFVAALLFAQVASAEVVKIEIQRRDDAGTHERLIGRVHFAVDPTLPANRGIADLDLVPTNRKGLAS